MSITDEQIIAIRASFYDETFIQQNLNDLATCSDSDWVRLLQDQRYLRLHQMDLLLTAIRERDATIGELRESLNAAKSEARLYARENSDLRKPLTEDAIGELAEDLDTDPCSSWPEAAKAIRQLSSTIAELRKPVLADTNSEVERIRQNYYDFTNGSGQRPNWHHVSGLLYAYDELRKPIPDPQCDSALAEIVRTLGIACPAWADVDVDTRNELIGKWRRLVERKPVAVPASDIIDELNQRFADAQSALFAALTQPQESNNAAV